MRYSIGINFGIIWTVNFSRNTIALFGLFVVVSTTFDISLTDGHAYLRFLPHLEDTNTFHVGILAAISLLCRFADNSSLFGKLDFSLKYNRVYALLIVAPFGISRICLYCRFWVLLRLFLHLLGSTAFADSHWGSYLRRDLLIHHLPL